MKVGIISDTHDQGALLDKAVERFNAEKIDLLIHCGDWISPFILYHFKNLKAPIKGVFGNNDGDKFRHVSTSQWLGLDITYEDRFLELQFDQRLVAVFHGDYEEIVHALVHCGKYDAVFHGHSHERVNKRVGNTLSINPGSLIEETLGKGEGPSVAVYDTIANEARHILL